MQLLEILFALWWIWLPLLIVWYFVSKSKQTKQENQGSEKDLQWHNYILSFKDVVKTKAERNLLDAMLTRKTADQLYEKSAEETVAEVQPTAADAATVSEVIEEPTTTAEPKTKPKTESMDNTMLLLYFGAFLLTASAGLFVAFSDLDGVIRTVTLAITTALLYFGGVWIYRNQRKLAQAGISFMGVAMIIAPLIGVAWYNLISDQEYGAVIWLLTSLACLSLYIHAYSTVKNSFMAYLLIGSFVSTVESVVLAVSMPTYVFAWVAIIAGLALQILGMTKRQSKQLLDASNTGAQLLIPLSIVSSLILLNDFGSYQLGVTLLLSGGYYAVLAFARADKREYHSPVAQIAVISGLANILYSLQDSLTAVAVFLATATSLYIAMIAYFKLETVQKHGFISIASLAITGSAVVSLGDAWPLTVYVGIATVLAVVSWLKLRSNNALAVGGILLLSLPLLIGQCAIQPDVSSVVQTLLFSVPTILLGSVVILSSLKKSFTAHYQTAAVLYILSAVALLTAAWVAGLALIIIVSVLLAGSFAGMHYASKVNDWWVLSSITIVVPAVFALFEYGTDDNAFSLMVGVAVLVNIAISLITRERAIRWILVGCVLVTPVAVGGGGLGFRWEEAGFSAGYLIAMAGLVLARAIARGKLFVSSKVPLSSYDTDASLAYVAGYSAAGTLAVCISLADSNSQLVTSIVLGILCAAVLYIGYIVESRQEILLLLPLLLQGLLFSVLRPDLSDKVEIGTAAIISSGLAAAVYFVGVWLPRLSQDGRKLLLPTAVITAYFGSLLVFFGVEISYAMPASLLLAGLLTLHYNRTAVLNSIELSSSVILGSIFWYLYLSGIDNVHVYTHLGVLFLALFAYIRYLKKDDNGRELHVVGLFILATVPMILEALLGDNGQQYGLILIVQQVAFMVIGIVLNQRFLVKAGLWVAIGSILYQLRGLGWAFLAIVAVVIIAIAVYRLQRSRDDSPHGS